MTEHRKLEKKEKKKYRGIPYVLIIAGFAIAISLGIIIFLHGIETQTIGEIKDGKLTLAIKPIWPVILEHLATAIFILGVWHTFDHLLIRREFNIEIRNEIEELRDSLKEQDMLTEAKLTDAFEISRKGLEERLDEAKSYFATAKHDAQFGLVSTFHEANHFGFSSMITESHSLTAVMADGYSWLGRHNEAFLERFKHQKRSTTFILVHPESDLIPVISRKIGMSPALYKERIYATVREIRKIAGTADVTILGHSLINCHAIYLADKEVVYSPYFLSSQRRIPPVIALKDAGASSFFQKLTSDISFLEKEALPIVLPENKPIRSDI